MAATKYGFDEVEAIKVSDRVVILLLEDPDTPCLILDPATGGTATWWCAVQTGAIDFDFYFLTKREYADMLRHRAEAEAWIDEYERDCSEEGV